MNQSQLCAALPVCARLDCTRNLSHLPCPSAGQRAAGQHVWQPARAAAQHRGAVARGSGAGGSGALCVRAGGGGSGWRHAAGREAQRERPGPGQVRVCVCVGSRVCSSVHDAAGLHAAVYPMWCMLGNSNQQAWRACLALLLR